MTALTKPARNEHIIHPGQMPRRVLKLHVAAGWPLHGAGKRGRWHQGLPRAAAERIAAGAEAAHAGMGVAVLTVRVQMAGCTQPPGTTLNVLNMQLHCSALSFVFISRLYIASRIASQYAAPWCQRLVLAHRLPVYKYTKLTIPPLSGYASMQGARL